jgi:hypothetical protein
MEETIKIKYNLKIEEFNIRIFGKEFVDNNKDKLQLEINGKRRELIEFYIYMDSDIEGEINPNIEIVLMGLEKITNMSHMFEGCETLLSIQETSKWISSNLKDMSNMFYECNHYHHYLIFQIGILLMLRI